MPVSLIRQVRAVLDSASDALPLDELLTLVDTYVLECSSSEDPEILIAQFEEELQAVHHDVVDYSNLRQGEVFLTVLYHLAPVIPSTSVISWFDLVLRPALREPRLSTTPVNYARDLIVQALQKTQDVYSEKNENYTERIAGFRKRFFDLYLLDAFNEGSKHDALAWAELDDEEQERRVCWKRNLEQILIRYGLERPEDFFSEILVHFADPSARLQLFTLLNLLSSNPSYSVAAAILSKHQLLQTLTLSIFLDNSSTVCTVGLTFLAKSLPYFAVHSREQLRSFLPHLLAALARVLCWKERPPAILETGDETPDLQLERELAEITNPTLHARQNIQWRQLEMTFDSTTSHPPNSRSFFTTLFYLYPSNVLKFLRGPFAYLASYNIETPYSESWKDAFDEDEIRRKSENLLREHICHPLLIWKDASVELATPEFWSRYDISRIVSEAIMLDIRNLATGLRERYGYTGSFEASPSDNAQQVEREVLREAVGKDEDWVPPPQLPRPVAQPLELVSPRIITSFDLSNGKAAISLTDMIHVSNALKSNIDVHFIKPEAQWMSGLQSRSPSPSKLHRATSTGANAELSNPDHAARTMSLLQKKVILLKNDLNFELWIQRENAKHIGKLYQDRVLMKTAEAERQGLYNKLRKYRAQVIGLEAELREHKQQASSAKNKYADWNVELQKKLRELREEKKSWISEAATLRSAEKEAKALFSAQTKLLAEATEHVAQLQIQKKENQHKIDRLQDYERQIEQHIKIQRLWDQDYAKFNARGEQLVAMQNEIQQLKIRLESYEKTQAEMEENARMHRRQVQALEAKLALANKKAEGNQPFSEGDLQAFVAEKALHINANKKLREQNGELNEEVEELRAMVEMLKAEHTGKKGLISEHRASISPL